MPAHTLSPERIRWILARVELIGSTDRKPDGSDPDRWNAKAQKRRFGGAYPRDLGARRRNQTITRDMHLMVKLGYLERVPGLWFPGFIVRRKEHTE